MLSTLDWALIETWREAGIPLEAVLRGIDSAFDKHDAQRLRAGARHARSTASPGAPRPSSKPSSSPAKPASAPQRAVDPFRSRQRRRESGFESARIARYLEPQRRLLDAAATTRPARRQHRRRSRFAPPRSDAPRILDAPPTLNLKTPTAPSPSSKKNSSPRSSPPPPRPNSSPSAPRPTANSHPSAARCRPSRSNRSSSNSCRSVCSKPTPCPASASSTCPTKTRPIPDSPLIAR